MTATDLQRLDAILTNLRAAERDAGRLATQLSEARDALAAAPDSAEAAEATRMAEVRMRTGAAALAHHFAALAVPEWQQ